MPEKFNELLLKQDIIELYNAGITPDYGYLMNGRFEKDMIKTMYSLKTLSGNPISWEASDTEYLFPVISLEPKQAGSGDPSPENVRPISGYDGVTVNVQRGKNLFGGESIEGVVNADNDQLIVGPTKEHLTFITRITPGETYTASRKTTGIIRLGVSPEKPYLGITFSNTVSITGNKLSITAGENDEWIACNVPYYQDDEVQLELGPTPTPYEPYQGDTYNISLPETVYGGTVDAVTGVGEKTWFNVILTGNETWETWGANWPNSFYTDIEGHKNLANNAINVFCSSFSFNIRDDRYTPHHFFSQNPGALPDNVRLCFTFDETVTDVELAKQWMAAQASAGTPVQVVYKLATPEPFQATGNQALTIQSGNHTMYTDGNNISLSRKARRLEV